MTLSHIFILSVVAGSIYFGTGKQSAAETAPDPHHPEHKWACTSASRMWPNERPARGVGAPMCKDGYAATEWYCLGDELIHSEYRGVTEEGQPRCREGYTASKVRHLNSEDAPIQLLKQLPQPMRNGVPVPQDQIHQTLKSVKQLAQPSVSNFFYERGDYNAIPTTGVRGTLLVEKPFFVPVNIGGIPYGHTLGQIAALSTNTVTSGGVTTTKMQTVELGWNVDAAVNADIIKGINYINLNPHLFVSRSINNNYQSSSPAGQTCYNNIDGCGFFPIPGIISVGEELTEGEGLGLAIEHRTAKGAYPAGWYVTVTVEGIASDIGYYDDTLWSNAGVTPAFVQANDVQWFGEVSLPVVNGTMAPATAAMGNGRRAESDQYAANVTDAQIIDSSGNYITVNPVLSASQTVNVAGSTNLTASSLYENHTLSAGAFAYGGPGLASREAYIPVCGMYNVGDVYLGTINFYDNTLNGYTLGTQNDTCGGVSLSQDATKLYIAAEQVSVDQGNAANEILSIDVKSGAILQTIQAYAPYGGIALTPDGNKLLVANLGTPGTLDIIDSNAADTATYNTVINKISGLDAYGGQIAIGPDGNEVYVTGNNRILVIDIPTLKVVRTLESGMRPCNISISPDGTLLYTVNCGSLSSGDGSQTVSVVTISTSYNAGKPFSYSYGYNNNITNGGFVPVAVAFAPDSSKAYISWSSVAGTSSGTLTAVDTKTQELTSINPFGTSTSPIYFPGAVNVTPDGRFVYLVTEFGITIPSGGCERSNSYCASVVKIDTATNNVLGQSAFPNTPLDSNYAAAFGNFTGGR